MDQELRVILVEDSEDDAFLILRALKRGGFTPHSVRVESCQALVKALAAQEWDIVLSDYSLPQCSGIEALELVAERRPDLPVVMVSGVIGEETAAGLIRRGAYDYVLKDRLERLCPAVSRALHDAGERRAREKSERKVKAIFERTAVGILILDLDRVIREANAAFSRMLGYGPEEVIGRSLADFTLPGETAPGLFFGGGDYAQAEQRWQRRDGSPLWVGNSLNLIRDGQGRPDFVVGIVEDITARKRAEEERLAFERQLQQSQKLESLGIMAGGIAHDFNNLLMAVLGNLDLALEGERLPEGTGLKLENAVQAARRAAALTRQMLDYVGKSDPRPQPLDLADLVRANLSLMAAAVPKRIHMHLDCQTRVPPIMADPAQVQQVFMNLITNAAEAIPEGQAGEITVALGLGDFDDAALKASRLAEPPAAGRFVSVTVRDTGCGMDAETQQRLFDPFFTTKFMGRGLGMSAVLGIVRTHQGAIMVDSSPGRGTTFQVLFPAPVRDEATNPWPDTPARMPQGRREPAPRAGGQGLVLLVDDEEMVLAVCREMIKSLGLMAITARDGIEALAAFRARREEIGLVILDLAMPRMDGWTTLDQIRKLNPETQVVIATGYDESDLPGREGVAGVIAKPYSLSSLRALLDKFFP